MEIGFKNGKDSSKQQFNEQQFLKDKTQFDLKIEHEQRAPRLQESYFTMNDKLSIDMNTSQYYIFDQRQSIETQQISISNSIAIR